MEETCVGGGREGEGNLYRRREGKVKETCVGGGRGR